MQPGVAIFRRICHMMLCASRVRTEQKSCLYIYIFIYTYITKYNVYILCSVFFFSLVRCETWAVLKLQVPSSIGILLMIEPDRSLMAKAQHHHRQLWGRHKHLKIHTYFSILCVTVIVFVKKKKKILAQD